jgi:hypothetical protein
MRDAPSREDMISLRPKETAKRAGAGVVLHSIQEAPDRGSRDDGLASLLRTRDSDLQKEATAVAR